MNTSLPRMFSLNLTETSPSSKRPTSASPIGVFNLSQIDCASCGWRFPRRCDRLQARTPVWFARRTGPAAIAGGVRAHVATTSVAGGEHASDSLLGPRKLAGAGGFEPPDARSKVSCLTTWPRPTNRTGFPSRSGARNRASGVMATGPERCRAAGKAAGRLPGRRDRSQPRERPAAARASENPARDGPDRVQSQKSVGRAGRRGLRHALRRGIRQLALVLRTSPSRSGTCGSWSLIGCARSWCWPSGRLRLGIATNSPELPRMILSPRITNESFSVMLTKALSLSSFRSETRDLGDLDHENSPRSHRRRLSWFGGAARERSVLLSA